MVPLQIPGFPGLAELLVFLMVIGIYVAVPILVIVAVYNFLDGKRGYDERIAALERRMNELENE